ncbi:GH25 family lysozyme [Polyangium sp. 15x6]|uniref:GH25 family lysozyme n=1 Tax=Polyangium sp. 15x6 TaxID=3042687 RepID=UPI00249C748D|nr:GH25 family lysozyme [Polyangium sp. 15x6]MDI3289846.1 GH25 family lysozyme [Polyangium sp. 15x6]
MHTSSSLHLFRASLLPLAALVLPACGADAFDSSEGPLAETEQAFTVCADGDTVEGIDVSVWQAEVNWDQVKGAGIEFAIARVSYGTSKDTWFDTNWSGIKSAGLVRGAYQFFLPHQDAIAQADLMIDAMGELGPGDLPPVLDVEDMAGQSKSTVVSKMKQWLAHVEAATGAKPIIYTGKYFWQDNVASYDFGDYPLWIPNYSFDCPNLPDNYWDQWILFQYTDSGSVPGVAGNVDRNAFNGSLADLMAFANSGPEYAAKFVSQSFPYASEGPLQVEAGGTLEAYIEMLNVGTKAWDGNTLLATTEPRDRTSPFAGPEWPGPNRYARVEGTVPPGGTYKFTFTLHAPLETGVYDEHFGLVQEGVTWFSDPGQGGPPDAQLEGLFEVVPGMGAGGAGVGGAGGNGGGDAGDAGGAGGNGGGLGSDPGSESGCAMATGGARGAGSFGLALFLGLGSVMRRRRRASA